MSEPNELERFDFDSECKRPDWFSITSITLGELYEDGWLVWDDGTWDFPKYNDEQDARLKSKILEHYYMRDISLVPPGLWKREFLRTMNEIMPKYILLYKLVTEEPSLMFASSEYYKSRNIYSDFPQTQLAGKTSDYASAGNDMEFERIRQDSILDIAKRLEDFSDVDTMIVNELEPLFSFLLTMNVNAF